MGIKEDHVWHIQNLMDSEPEAQVVELYVAERLVEENAALVKELEAVKASIPKIKADAVRSLLDEDCWDSRIDGELYFKGSSIAEYADELEEG